MKKPLIIFGTGKIADVVFECFSESGEYEVIAFTCDDEFIAEQSYHQLPVESFNAIEKKYSPNETYCFVAIGYQELNAARTNIIDRVKNKGFKLASYISSDVKVPQSTSIGEHCFIMYGTLLQPKTTIGNNTFIWGGAIIGHHSSIGNNCWIVSGAKIAGSVTLGDNNFIAMNATIANELTIGNSCFIGANTLVTKNLLDESVIIESSSNKISLKPKDFIRLSNFQ